MEKAWLSPFVIWENWYSETRIHWCPVVHLGSWVPSDRLRAIKGERWILKTWRPGCVNAGYMIQIRLWGLKQNSQGKKIDDRLKRFLADPPPNSEHFIIFDLSCSAVSTVHLVPKSGRSLRLCLHLLSLPPSSGRLSLHSHFYANNSQIDASSLDLSQELQSHLSKGQDIGQDIITSSQTQYLFLFF